VNSRHRIPYSLLDFEETVISCSLNSLPLELVNGSRGRRLDAFWIDP
jgi:hypothetical protein